ncbi:MAG: hypothetical protein QOH01_2614 [Verrucomicrobiota bacterium]|jgi:hypothetical protein
MACWTLAAATLALSLTGFLGFGIWLLPWPVAVVILVLALKRGIKGRGIALLITAILLVPLSYVAQFGSLAVYGTSAMMEQEWQETQVLQNLRAIATAKAAWVRETETKNGAPVTMANLTSYLGGKEIMPVVDERYDPRSVGTEPTATLPEGKHFWDYPTGGGAYTAVGLEQILSQRSHNPVNMAVGQFLHPSEKWLPLFWKSSPVPGVSPAPTIVPDE